MKNKTILSKSLLIIPFIVAAKNKEDAQLASYQKQIISFEIKPAPPKDRCELRGEKWLAELIADYNSVSDCDSQFWVAKNPSRRSICVNYVKCKNKVNEDFIEVVLLNNNPALIKVNVSKATIKVSDKNISYAEEFAGDQFIFYINKCSTFTKTSKYIVKDFQENSNSNSSASSFLGLLYSSDSKSSKRVEQKDYQYQSRSIGICLKNL